MSDEKYWIQKEKKPFTYNEMPIKPGLSFYMFSDGFVDQFDGPAGKKFLSKSFKKLLLNIQDKTMAEQEKILDKTLEDWRAYPDTHGKTCDQVDDIIVLGIIIEKL